MAHPQQRVNLFKQEQKEDQSFHQWHIHLYGLGGDANIDELTGRDWILFILIQSCKSQELKKKIFDLDDNKVTLANVLALARKYERTKVACAEKETISNIFVKKESKQGGKATPSQPVQQLQATQSSTNANAKANQTGAKKPCSPPTSTGRTAQQRRTTAQTARRRATPQSSATTENVRTQMDKLLLQQI
jgi:hypothetical protein